MGSKSKRRRGGNTRARGATPGGVACLRRGFFGRVVRHVLGVLPRERRELGLEPQRVARDPVLGRELRERGADEVLAVMLRLARCVDPAESGADRGDDELGRGLLLPRGAVEERQLASPERIGACAPCGGRRRRAAAKAQERGG